MRKSFPISSKRFGDRLKTLMDYNNLSSLELAVNLCGYSDKPKSNTAEYIECRKKARTIENHLKLGALDNLNSSESLSTLYLSEYCSFFNCSADYFLGLIDYPTKEEEDIGKITGLSKTAINTLASWYAYQKDMKKKEQKQIYFPIEILNILLSYDTKTEFLLHGIQDLLKSNYKIPAYHNGKYEVSNINKKYDKCLIPQYMIPESELDVIKGNNNFNDIYLLTLVRDKTKPWDNTQITLNDDFFEAIAMKKIEKYLFQIKKEYLEKNDD